MKKKLFVRQHCILEFAELGKRTIDKRISKLHRLRSSDRKPKWPKFTKVIIESHFHKPKYVLGDTIRFKF